MDVQHHIGPRHHEILVAAFELSAAEIRGRQIPLLQHRAHGSVEHQDPLAQELPKSDALLDKIPHRVKYILSKDLQSKRRRMVLRCLQGKTASCEADETDRIR